ncbi:MAG TPA: hypothetical protein VEU33_06880 [Archangium sp.]|nr:hypothetical protein [Archangium sp.]
MAEFYRRRAEGYLFLRQVLRELLGEEALTNARRVLPSGATGEPLLEELVRMEQLFRGAHAIVRKELGVEEVPPAVLPAAQATQHWLSQWEDPDLTRDPRCVVPLFFDTSRRKTKVLAFLGFHLTTVTAQFARGTEVCLTDWDGHPMSSEQFFRIRATEHLTVRPVTAELYMRWVPDRAEFQALCDKHVSSGPILNALRD